MKIIVWFLFWFVYVPLIRLLDLVFFWHPKVLERNRFEKRNKFERLAHSFSEIGTVADICFEFSSEGEYQQVAPLIDDALKAGKKVELIFFSPSVEKTIMKLASQHPEQIRYLRYPFIRILPFVERRSFSHWVTAKTLVMVRYDLFPEFLLWSLKSGNRLKMIWMTFKKERSRGKGTSSWKKFFLKQAETILWAGQPDMNQGTELNLRGSVFDFRTEQIRRRIVRREEKFKSHFFLYPEFKGFLQNQKGIILGNAWPSDLFLLRDIGADVPVVVVPHQLSAEILRQFHEGLTALGRRVSEVSDATSKFEESKTILINKKGILCELYADFSYAYVGGGFEGSIHSVLEPLVAGTPMIACGPSHHRSTEYDMALSFGRISEVNGPEQFREWYLKDHGDSTHVQLGLEDYQKMRELVVSC